LANGITLQNYATRAILLMMRREYDIDPVIVNEIVITKLIIDDHVDKHVDHINDDLIKKLIRSLNGETFIPAGERNGFQYFASVIKDGGQSYKLIWLLEDKALYIGVITAFRDRRIK
jgi:hypothetical protein